MGSPARDDIYLKINIYTFPLTRRWNIVLLIYEAGTKNMSQRAGLSVIFYLLIWICSSKCQKCEVLCLDSRALASSSIKDTFFVSPLDWRDKEIFKNLTVLSAILSKQQAPCFRAILKDNIHIASWSWSTAGPANLPSVSLLQWHPTPWILEASSC